MFDTGGYDKINPFPFFVFISMKWHAMPIIHVYMTYHWTAVSLKGSHPKEKMSLEFTQFLCALLVLPEASIDLKAGWGASDWAFIL